MIIYNTGSGWKQEQITHRTTKFSLAGAGTKAIPISRPQLVVQEGSDSTAAWMVYRDEERGSKVSIARTSNLGHTPWTISDLTTSSVHFWEPSFDPDLWNASSTFDLYVQDAQQGDGETLVEYAPQAVQVMELTSGTTGIQSRQKTAGTHASDRDILGRRAGSPVGIAPRIDGGSASLEILPTDSPGR